VKVVLSTNAAIDLQAIGDWIAAENPARAISFVNELIGAIAALSDMPSRFPVLEGHRELGIRRRVVGNYLILYHVGETEVEVLHVVHGARDYESLLE
jgi:plasmid stabilization system protein ParE